MKLRGKTEVLIIIAFLIVGIIIVGKFIFFPDKFVSKEFLRARLQSSEIAQKIVGFSAITIESLKDIAKYDKEGNMPEALILISKQLIENRKIHTEAIKLASELEKMARSLSDIKPAKARQISAEAVTAEVALVSHLINYNYYLEQLFKLLEEKFSKQVYSDGQVDDLIKKINEEVGAINDFDRRFHKALIELDNLLL